MAVLPIKCHAGRHHTDQMGDRQNATQFGDVSLLPPELLKDEQKPHLCYKGIKDKEETAGCVCTISPISDKSRFAGTDECYNKQEHLTFARSCSVAFVDTCYKVKEGEEMG